MFELLRRVLLWLPPEAAHSVALRLLRIAGNAPPLRRWVQHTAGARVDDPITVFGIRFPNRVGLAAGYDKDGIGWRGLAALGFGHLELGTVTPRAQPGNPRPRVFRLREDESLINRLGFPSRGADWLESRLPLQRKAWMPVLGVNIGKQKETPLAQAVHDYLLLMRQLGSQADYLTVNISSPNTPGLRQLQDAAHLKSLMTTLVGCRDEIGEAREKALPLLVKIAPDLAFEAVDELVDTLGEVGVDGVVATNTTRSREGVRTARGAEEGGLSGALLTSRSTRIVERIASRSAGRLPVVAVGGIMSTDDARRMRSAGAELIQLYTGLVYRGPRLVNEIATALEASVGQDQASVISR